MVIGFQTRGLETGNCSDLSLWAARLTTVVRWQLGQL